MTSWQEQPSTVLLPNMKTNDKREHTYMIACPPRLLPLPMTPTHPPLSYITTYPHTIPPTHSPLPYATHPPTPPYTTHLPPPYTTHPLLPYTTHLPPTLYRVGVGRGSKIWYKANIFPKLNYRHLVHSRQ